MPAFSLKQTNKTILLLDASKRGDLEEVNRLIPISNPKFQNSQALVQACLYGHIDVVKALIPVSDPKTINGWALRTAAEYGHTEILQLLLPVSNPADYLSAFREAVVANQIETINVFLPYLETPQNFDTALQLAAQYQKPDIIDILLPFSDYNLIYNHIRSNLNASQWKDSAVSLFQNRIEHYEARQQQKTLLEHIETEHSAAPSLKRKI